MGATVKPVDGYVDVDYHPRRKNTKRWCKGVIGRNHFMVEAVWLTFPRGVTWYLEKCATCGRHGKTRSEKIQ